MAAGSAIIRPARPADAAAVRDLLWEAWRHAYRGIMPDDLMRSLHGRWHAEEALASQIVQAGAAFLVAEDEDGMLVGHAMAVEDRPARLLVLRLYLSPTHHRRGLGTRLLRALEDRVPEAGATLLDVAAGNEPALAFYRALGFTETGSRLEEGIRWLRHERPRPGAAPA